MSGHGGKWLGVALSALAFCAHPAVAGDKLAYGPVAGWVKPVDIPKPDPALGDAPLQMLLENIQVHFAADGDSTYSEYAVRVQTAQGLQAAQSILTWNPDNDEATINKAVIIRNGQVIDLLKGQTYTILRRETNIELSMLDGVLTGVLQPEGLQIGDTIDYAMTVRRNDPVFRHTSQALFPANASVPVGKIVIRASWDTSKPVRFRQSDALPKAKVSTTKDGTEVVVEADHYTTPPSPAEAPPRFNQGGYVEFSQFDTWKDVSRLMAPLFEAASTLTPESPVKAEAAKIRAASASPKGQATMALKLVETNVRYLFLGMNQGGYMPASADITWQRRFGDCKGKTVLLLALLRELGIKADAVAVSTQAGDGLDGHLPQMLLFDHVIVRAEIAGKVYWLDGTRPGDTDIDRLEVPPYAWALPLRTEGADLEVLKVLPYDKPETETFIRLDATAGLDVPARAHVEMLSRYDDAIATGLTLQGMSATDRDKKLKEYWAGEYNWITPTKVSATYDAAKGEVRFVMDGDARMAWDQDDKSGGWKYTTDVTPVGWGLGFHRDPGPHNDAPMVIAFPNYYVTHEEIDLPKGGKGFTFTGGSFDKTEAGTEFHRKVAMKGNVFTLDASKRSTVPEVSFAEATKASDGLVRMFNDVVYVVAPRNYKSGAVATAAASGMTPVTAEEFVTRGQQKYANKDEAGAMADFNQALRMDPSNAHALNGRGGVLVLRGKADAGLADCRQAAEVDPKSWTALNCIGQAYIYKHQPAEAIDAYTKALAIYPNNIWALQGRAAAYQSTGEKAKAKADADAALDLDPASDWAIGVLTQMALIDGKFDEAQSTVDKAMAASPDDLSLVRMKIAVLEWCGSVLPAKDCLTQKATAVPLYDRIIAADPKDGQNYALRAQDRLASDHAAALADLDTASRVDPKNATPYLVRAAFDIRDKNNDKALADVNAALAVEPDNDEALDIRVTIYFLMKRNADAGVDLDTLQTRHSADGNALNSICWTRAINNYQLDKALEACNASLKVKPGNAAATDSRAFVELRLGQYDTAIADYDTALTLEPKLVASLYGRGIARLRKGQKDAGNADLAAARKIAPGVDDQFKAYGVTP